MYNLVYSIIQEPLFIIAVVSLIGFVIQKTKWDQTISGIVLTLLGYTLIIYGSKMVIESISIFVRLFQNAFRLFGLIPNNESMMAILQMDYSYQTTIVLITGVVFNLVFARITLFKYIFLNGHYILFMSSFLAAILTINLSDNPLYLIGGGIFLGFILAMFPALGRPFSKKIIGDKNIAIGFFGLIGCVIAGYIGKLLASNKPQDEQAAAPLDKRTKSLPFFSDSIIMIAVFMMILFAVTAFFSDRGVINDMSNQKNFLVFAIKYSIIFSAGFYVIISGVRMFTEHLLQSFKGISEKIVPNAVPAVDCSILFPYRPQLVIIGFVSSFAGGMISVFLQVMLHMTIVIPGIITHFFAGSTSAFFGYAYGGKRGAFIGSFVQGIVISFLPILSIAIFKKADIMRTSFADSDFTIIGVFIDYVIKMIKMFA